MQGAKQGRIRKVLVHLRGPMDFCHLGAVGKRLAIVGDAGPEGFHHLGIGEDDSDQLEVGALRSSTLKLIQAQGM
jgi:hypothetical protein